MWTVQENAEHYSLAGQIGEPGVVAATYNEELGVMVQAGRLFEGFIAADEDRANTARAWACETLNNMSEIWAFVEWLTQTAGAKHARVVALNDADLVRLRLSITDALS